MKRTRTTRRDAERTILRSVRPDRAAAWILARANDCQSDAERFQLQTRHARRFKIRSPWLKSWQAGRILRAMPAGRTVTIRATPTKALREQADRAAREAAPDWYAAIDALAEMRWGETRTI